MSRYNIHLVYIADGFADDCDELVHRCAQLEVLSYHAFCNIWKEMNFATVFKGRSSGAEIAELSEEFLFIAKSYMMADTGNFEESVAGLFLVYALLNLQPYPGFAALRVIPEDVPAIHRIRDTALREKRMEVLYILGSVLIRGPCQFHAAQRERGMESGIRKYLEGYTSIDSQGVRAKGVLHRQNVELSLLRELNVLTRRYSTAKALINGGKGRFDPSLNYTNDDLPNELYASIKKVINGVMGEEDEEASANHYSTVQEIKSRAMSGAIKPTKHIVGIEERKASSDIKTKAGKVKSGSPKKPLPTSYSPKKRKCATRGGNKSKKVKRKTKYSSSESDDDDEELNLPSDDELSDEFDQDTSNDQAEDDVEAEKGKDQPEQEIDIEIESLPVFTTTETNGNYVEIEIIDEYKKDINTSEPTEKIVKENINRKNAEKVQDKVKNTITGQAKSPKKNVKKANKNDQSANSLCEALNFDSKDQTEVSPKRGRKAKKSIEQSKDDKAQDNLDETTPDKTTTKHAISPKTNVTSKKNGQSKAKKIQANKEATDFNTEDKNIINQAKTLEKGENNAQSNTDMQENNVKKITNAKSPDKRDTKKNAPSLAEKIRETVPDKISESTMATRTRSKQQLVNNTIVNIQDLEKRRKFKKISKRDLKNTVLKSKLKRLGMLQNAESSVTK